MVNTTTKRPSRTQGMNWIRQEKRLAIYLRDGMACCWCGESVESGARLTLDHCQPYSKGGTNKEGNLITACGKCNSSRGNRSLKSFATVCAAYQNQFVSCEEILAHIHNTRRRAIDVDAARELRLKRVGTIVSTMP